MDGVFYLSWENVRIKAQPKEKELLWLYVTSKFAVKPGPVCYKDGIEHQINIAV